MNNCVKPRRENNGYSHVCSNPSFSSTLLDEIYCSIDCDAKRNDELKIFRERMMEEKQSRSRGKMRRQREEEENLHRACLIDKWMDRDVPFWCSTSSDSSSGGFSSSDSESIFASKSAPCSCFTPARLQPIRTTTSLVYEDYHKYNSATEKTPKRGERIIQAKSKALKIYSNLKKVKQPISPGGRLSSFFNSLFTSGNTKKTRNPSMAEKASDASACSSVSSFSRPCLRKNSHLSREKLLNGVQRTGRLSPESVVVDEDFRPCSHKCFFEYDSSVFREFSINEDEDDDDAASYSSSDLFELDHLAGIGSERFYQDLPVYETTHIKTHSAIANGLII